MKKQLDRNAWTQGFTLVEMSMVVVIIGILVGGIVSFASFQKNAQIKTMMNEANYYESAFSQFQSKYNSPPGDYSTASLAWTGAFNGNGDGMVAYGNNLESYYAWQHLALAGLIEGNYTGAVNAYGGATAGVSVPAAAVDKGAYYFSHPAFADGFVVSDANYPDGQYGNVLIIAGLSANATNLPSNAFLTPKEMQKIDDKYDDGMPYTGNIVSVKPAAMPSCTIAASSSYNTSGYEDKDCIIVMKVQ